MLGQRTGHRAAPRPTAPRTSRQYHDKTISKRETTAGSGKFPGSSRSEKRSMIVLSSTFLAC